MLEALTAAIANLTTVEHFVYLGVGVVLGLTVGVFPGLGGIAGLSLLMPFLYGMDTVSALAMLIGLVAVIPTSDTFTSVLMGIPGSSASQATVLDGFPLSQQGQAARALAAAFGASLCGGLVGAVILTVFVQIARPLILTFGSAELFMLAVLGLSMVGVLSGSGLWKGLAAAGFGMTLGSIGSAPATGEFRITFGVDYLYDGLPLVVVGIGLFAVPEIIDLLRKGRPIATGGRLEGRWSDGLRDLVRHWALCLRCSALGTIIGAIPGLGGTVVDWIAYGHVVQVSKDKSQFGKGDIRGVLAPESANNAKEGGGLVPTLLFGIPGSGAMAVFLGGMVLLGIEAGPAMVSSNLDLTYTIVWSLALANVLGAGLCIVLARPIARLTTVPFNYLAPFMIVAISFAAFQATRDLMDLVALLGVGVIGVLLKRFDWSRPAFLIGFVLAPQAEAYLNLAAQFYGWQMLIRPGVLIILAITVVSVWLGARGAQRSPIPVAGDVSVRGSDEPIDSRPQLIFVALVAALLVYAIASSLQRSPLAAMFPVIIGIATLLACLYVGGVLAFGPPGSRLNFDAEQSAGTAKRSAIPMNLAWIAGFIAATALGGFIIATAAYLVLFLKLRAGAGIVKALTMALVASLVLWGTESLVVVELPRGLLQFLWGSGL
ncbi:tripartite tricarboxylate transporter permease [Candidatus Rariloculus sp.]|uniref:tripartite tricarboxylate transporter permease n=1 Tax=Candidatus Rariloculus sp. TaxID=3101265 RepID=UPI003D0EF6BE